MSTATIIAVGVNTDGRREVLGVATGPSEAETFWKGFLRSLADRGLRGVKLVTADDHKGLRAAAAKIFHATLQRCRVHWMRNLLTHAPAKQRPAVIAMVRTIFAQETAAEARAQWKTVADALRERAPKLAALMDASLDDVLAYTAYPKEHWPQISSTNPLERLNGEIKRRSDVVGIFPNDRAVIRLVGALMLEQNDALMATMYLKHTLEIDPKNSMAHALLGRAYRALGRTDDAVVELKAAAKLQESKTGSANGTQ